MPPFRQSKIACAPSSTVRTRSSVALYILNQKRTHLSDLEARFGLTRREWGVMATLATEEGLLSSKLAQKVQLDRARTSRALSGLEEKGWVLRKPLDGDRRRVAIYLTEEGRRMYGLILPEMVKIHADIVSVLSDEELALFDGLLAKALKLGDTYYDKALMARTL